MTCLGRASCPAISFQSRPKFGRVCPYFMRSFCICERILKPSSGEFDGGEFRDGPSMSPQRRTTITRPALWIAVPTFVVSLAVAASLKAGVLAALVVGLIGAGLVGAFAEARLARIISSIDRIARGDRYTSLPESGRRRRHPAIRRHRRNRARRVNRGRHGVGRPAPARNRSAPASRRPAVLHRQFPPRGGRGG